MVVLDASVVLVASTPRFLTGHGDVGGFDWVAATSLICELVAHALENRHGASAQVGAALSGVFWVSNLDSANKLVDSLLVGETDVGDIPKSSKARAVLVYEDLCGSALVGA